MLVEVFLGVLRFRGLIAGAFLVLMMAGIYGALHIPTDSAIERLVVAGDPVVKDTQDFERLFPDSDHALLMLEAPDPLSLDCLRAALALERKLASIRGIEAHSLLAVYPHLSATSELTSTEAAQIRTFATGTPLFRRAGLLGDHYLGIALDLRVSSPVERDQALQEVDSLALPLANHGGPFSAVRRVGSPWLEAWLERQTGEATARFMPLFGVFVVTLVLILYRSWRTLVAIILTLGALVAIAMGLAVPAGWTQTVISALVPLTVMVTTTATLVYIQSQCMETDDSPTAVLHHARALAIKFLPCTASMFATAVGFGALAVSDIGPVRDMGIWTACGIIVAWFGCFTLFPSLQSLLRVPMRSGRTVAGKWFQGFVAVLVPASRRYRWVAVVGAIVLMACGVVALFGIPGAVTPMPVEMDVLSYVNPSEAVAQDTRHFEQSNGLDVVELWLQTPDGHALDPSILRAVEALKLRFEADPRITAVDGPTSVLQWARYVQTGSDRLPTDTAAWGKLAEDLEQIMLTQPQARQYVDIRNLANLRLSIRGRAKLFGRIGSMRIFVEHQWATAAASDPALHGVVGKVVGKGVLGAEITRRLVPTLLESFALTAGVIFTAFLLVFRSPVARLMTMIPSLFAILSVFLLMRVAGMPLNIATILIASTVLGATENDQIHFFYHFQEGRSTGTTASALRHALQVAGRPILFATLINASGFLALALSDLPPMREFGIVSASAFCLALLADFTALPAALWILSNDRQAAATVPGGSA